MYGSPTIRGYIDDQRMQFILFYRGDEAMSFICAPLKCIMSLGVGWSGALIV